MPLAHTDANSVESAEVAEDNDDESLYHNNQHRLHPHLVTRHLQHHNQLCKQEAYDLSDSIVNNSTNLLNDTPACIRTNDTAEISGGDNLYCC